MATKQRSKTPLAAVPRATDPPPQTVSRRARPHNVVWVQCTAPGYEHLQIGVCLSFTPAERQAREISLQGQITHLAAELAATQTTSQLATAETDLLVARSVAADAQAAADVAPEDEEVQTTAAVAMVQVRVAEDALTRAQAARAQAVREWEQELAMYRFAMRYVDGWDGWEDGEPPEPMNMATFYERCPPDLLWWLYIQQQQLFEIARLVLLPKLSAARPTLPATSNPG